MDLVLDREEHETRAPARPALAVAGDEADTGRLVSRAVRRAQEGDPRAVCRHSERAGTAQREPSGPRLLAGERRIRDRHGRMSVTRHVERLRLVHGPSAERG